MGEFSPILEMPPGQPQVLILVRMHARDDPPPPEFEYDRVQKSLRQVISNLRDNGIMEYEQGKLGQSAYTWLHPGLLGAREALAARGLIPSNPATPGSP